MCTAICNVHDTRVRKQHQNELKYGYDSGSAVMEIWYQFHLVPDFGVFGRYPLLR